MNIGVIGPGRVGTGLAQLLSERGYRVRAVAGRNPAGANKLAAGLPDCEAVTPQGVADTCELVFITTPDGAIASVAQDVNWLPGQGVIHCSGALPAAALAVVTARGALPGAFHPLQTLPDVQAALANLPGSFIAIEAEEPLLGRLAEIASTLGCRWGYISPEARPAYHAAAVLVSNYTVALAHAGTELWQALGKSEAEALHALLPLLRGTVRNLDRLGPAQALTGPVARGDWTTVAENLQAIAGIAPQHALTYAALALAMIYNDLTLADNENAPGGTHAGAGRDEMEQELRSFVSATLNNRGTP